MAWIQNCIFLVTGMAEKIKIKNVGLSVLEYPVDLFNGFISKIFNSSILHQPKSPIKLNTK
jgi:hypothetical protein